MNLTNNNIKNIKNIILIGGDGLIHEVAQGLIDINVYDKLIYIIPSGSGNGLAKSLNINSICDGVKCILNIDNNKLKYIKQVDLFEMIYNDKKEYSLLSQTWGMISDIDIGTEWLRWIGELRFFWGIFKFLFKNTPNKGIINYKLDNTDYKSIEGDFTLFCASNVKWISSDFKMLPDANMNDQLIDIIYIVNYAMSFFEKILLLYYCLNGEHINKCKFINYIRTSEYTLTEIESKYNSNIVCDGENIYSKKIHIEKTNKQLLFIYNVL